MGKVKRKIYVTVLFDSHIGLNDYCRNKYFEESKHSTGHYWPQEEKETITKY